MALSLGQRYRLFLTSGDIEWDNREWNSFVQRLLTLVSTPSSPILDATYRTTRLNILERGGEKSISYPCCYLYKGTFTPSANSDGYYWRPSRGVVKMGRMSRRYFYAQSGSVRIRRQISYLASYEWQFVEYRTQEQQSTNTLFSSIDSGCTQLIDLVTMVANDYLGIYPSQLENVPSRAVATPPSTTTAVTNNFGLGQEPGGKLKEISILPTFVFNSLDEFSSQFDQHEDRPEFCDGIYNHHCSLSDSRRARYIVRQVINPAAAEFDIAMNEDCVLHLKHDKYQAFYTRETGGRFGRWKCHLCDKEFRSANTMDNHLINKHKDLENGTQCMGSLCDILECDQAIELGMETPLMSEVKRKTKEECISSHKLKRRFYCERMFNKCFPPTTSESYSKLNGLLKRQFCDPLECDGKKVNHIDFAEKHGGQWGVTRVLYAVGGILSVVLLSMYILAVVAFKQENATASDLRSGRRNLFSMFKWKGKKKKGY
ncbi:hypothetical protein PROFUN_02595 [Planoprotostelium fungivorum]|uniref:C2H2-type domain-containing protein n=1 Tax=Planoprotostelium fungivorum TaxID=1890364 RepID=A0A2P6MPI3_9EUKA|nr:hypothetical protein PROFUN_02595 [Planoprotostelium fungivorum]